MVAIALEPEDQATGIAIQRMLDDGAPSAPPRRGRKSRWSPLELLDEPSADERAARRRLARIAFRVYCLACGRSSEMPVAPLRPGRCLQCGGTLLVEISSDS